MLRITQRKVIFDGRETIKTVAQSEYVVGRTVSIHYLD
jgi:hypothetical protein